MNLRFVNNLSQYAKSGYILTKISNNNLYEFSTKPLFNKDYQNNRKFWTDAIIPIAKIKAIRQQKIKFASEAIENILGQMFLKSSRLFKGYSLGKRYLKNFQANFDSLNGKQLEKSYGIIINNPSHKSWFDINFIKKFNLHYCKMQTNNQDDATFSVRLSNGKKERNEKNEDCKNGFGIGKGNYGGNGLFITAFTFSFFDSKQEEGDEDPSEKLVNQIKRSILCIQREQYDKAEQMLHLALRMAQDLQSKEGITYVYDLMANLAMEREQYKKAEKLFTDVLKRLFADGHGEDSPQVLHISSKLAHMAQLQGDLEKAHQGFTWTLERIGRSIQNLPEDKDLQELYGLTKNWFGQLLMKQGKYKEAKKHFEAAHGVLTEVYGNVNEAAITILNNLSVACVNLDDYSGAKEYLNKALDLVKELKDSTQEGILYANLGLIYLREGLILKAKESCSLAYRIGKQQNNPDAVEQAEYCLSEVKSSL